MSSRREILQRVADGDLSPEEAERLLQGGPEVEPPPAPAPTSAVRRVKVSVGVGGIDIVGDPAVAEAEVEGPHRAEVRDDELVIHGEWDAGAEGFTFSLGRRSRAVRIGGHKPGGPRLRVRMNPALELDAELDAGPLSITDISAPIRARVAAGPITIERFTGPLDVAVNAGAVRAVGRLTEGESRIRSDAGAVRVELDAASSVRVVAQAALGKVVVPGPDGRGRPRFGGDRREALIGDGTAELRVETAMGSVHVSVR